MMRLVIRLKSVVFVIVGALLGYVAAVSGPDVSSRAGAAPTFKLTDNGATTPVPEEKSCCSRSSHAELLLAQANAEPSAAARVVQVAQVSKAADAKPTAKVKKPNILVLWATTSESATSAPTAMV